MKPPLTSALFFKLLAGLLIAGSLYWLSKALLPWLGLFEPSIIYGDLAFILLMPIFMGIPGFLGIWFGYQGLRRTDAATIKGLVASYSVLLVFVLGSILSVETQTFASLNSEAAIRSICYLVSTLVAVTIYWFTSRYFLRSLGHSCAPVRQSLSRLPIALVAFQVWDTPLWALKDMLPAGETHSFARESLPIIIPIILGLSVYKLGVWLFVQQGSRAGSDTKGLPLD